MLCFNVDVYLPSIILLISKNVSILLPISYYKAKASQLHLKFKKNNVG